jgi:hypothetical protein
MATTTTSAAQEVDLFKKPEYGDLVKLPAILKENQLSALNAKAATDRMFEVIKLDNLKTGDITQIEADMASLASLQTKLAATMEKLGGKRMPLTRFLDGVKSLFTTEEKTVAGCIARIKGARDEWERVKAQRAADLRREQEEKIRRKQEAIDIRAKIKAGIERAYNSALLLAVQRMNEKYNAQPWQALEAYGEKLKAGVIDFSKLDFSRRVAVVGSLLTELEVQSIEVEVAKELEPGFAKDYAEKIDAERNRLIILIPSRIKALQADAEKEAKRVADEAAERARQAQRQQEEADQRAQAQAEAQKVEAVFEVASTAELAPERASGTVIKKVYRPATHADWLRVIQLYIARDYPALTLADVEKKFGFALTAANKRLNAGEAIEGMATEEDYSTRTQSKK